MANAPKLSVIILAGGRSSRMGRDKATIDIDGVPLLRRVYDVVAACRDGDDAATATDRLPITVDLPGWERRIYVVTPWAQKYRSILPATAQFIAEQQPHQGPLLAFAQGLESIETPWVLLLACDLPNLTTSVVQAGIDELPSVPARSIAYLPNQADKGWEPLCGFYRQSCHHSVRTYIAGGGQSFQGWLKLHQVTALSVSDPLWLANCNTPADLATIVANRYSP